MMADIVVNFPPIDGFVVLIWPLLFVAMFVGFAKAFIHLARKSESDGECAALGCAILTIGVGIMTFVMTWQIFAKGLGLPGY